MAFPSLFETRRLSSPKKSVRQESDATLIGNGEIKDRREEADIAGAQDGTAPGEDAAATDDLKRELSSRDLNMIAFSGSVGTGLIIGAGQSLHNGESQSDTNAMISELTCHAGGPASLLICFLVIGFVVWSVITALGEMATAVPMKKGFAGYATRFVDPCLG